MKQQSEMYRDLFDPGWREREAETLRKLMDAIPKRKPESFGLPRYPTGEVVGPCVCGSWPGGKCLRCPVTTTSKGGATPTTQEE